MDIVPFSIAGLAVGIILFWLLARFLGAWIAIAAMAVLLFFLVDYMSTISVLGLDYSSALTGPESVWGALGQFFLGLVVGVPLLLGAAIGAIWGVVHNRRAKADAV